MKRISIVFCAFLGISILSCQDETVVDEQARDAAVAAKLQSAGFDTSEGFQRYKDGYLVEYDIFLTLGEIDELSEAVLVHGNAYEEHYRTNNLVNLVHPLGQRGGNIVYVAMDPSFDSYMQNAFVTALARYAAVPKKMVIKSTGWFTGNFPISNNWIKIHPFYEESTVLGISGGFPSNGAPAHNIYLNTYYFNAGNQRQDAITTITHEIGHAIGFRHTDYMNRSFSCPSGGNEGPLTVGAVHIPGTPTGPESGSHMLACSNNTDRPLTTNDRNALSTLYPQ